MLVLPWTVLDSVRPATAGELADAVWGEDLPGEPSNALQSLVSRLRRTLGGAGAVEATATGYGLVVEPDDVDAVRFARLVAEGHRLVGTEAYTEAATALDEALNLWRGEPLVEDRSAVTSFVGRDDDVRAVGARLATARLVTLLGTGGAGKTRLATEVASAVLANKPGMPQAPDGVWFAELAPVTDPDDLALAILDAIGARDVTTGRLRGALGGEFDGLYGQGWGLARDEARARIDPARLVDSAIGPRR